MKLKLILSAFALFAVLLSACGPSATATPTARPTEAATAEVTSEATAEATSGLSGSAWLLTSMNGTAVSADTPISITFDDTTMGGVACNSFSGPYTANDGKLNVGQVVSTLKACLEPAGLTDLEATFFDTLGKATTYERTATTLTIGTTDDPKALVFKPDVRATS